MPKKCIDCGKSIKKTSTRCRTCECKSRKKPAKERFWEKVNKKRNGCWEWKANYIRNGFPYGLFMKSTNNFSLAHRFSWELHNGPIPDGMNVLHKCDNPKCVNPSHLFLGTHRDNMRDMANKNRVVSAKGESNHNSKLSKKDVNDIRKRYKSGNVSQTQLAKEYGVTQAAIWYIIHEKNWKD